VLPRCMLPHLAGRWRSVAACRCTVREPFSQNQPRSQGQHNCDQLDDFAALKTCTCGSGASRAEAEAALAEGLSLAALLPQASAEAVADMHTDILACVALWAGATGRSSASVGVSIAGKRVRDMALAFRLFCFVFMFCFVGFQPARPEATAIEMTLSVHLTTV
jgi:hypothetical protein